MDRRFLWRRRYWPVNDASKRKPVWKRVEIKSTHSERGAGSCCWAGCFFPEVTRGSEFCWHQIFILKLKRFWIRGTIFKEIDSKTIFSAEFAFALMNVRKWPVMFVKLPLGFQDTTWRRYQQSHGDIAFRMVTVYQPEVFGKLMILALLQWWSEICRYR
jgi:hypothetical protein